jgi:hypothetical protein
VQEARGQADEGGRPGGRRERPRARDAVPEVDLRHHRGAAAAFAWSFYSQGGGDARQASGDLFISEALGFFGDRDPVAALILQLASDNPGLLVLTTREPAAELKSREGQARLLLEDDGTGALDADPLVREHFGRRLREESGEDCLVV